MIGRVFINKDQHYFIEGKRELGFLYNNFEQAVINRESASEIIKSAILYTINFDLLVPPFDEVKIVNGVLPPALVNAEYIGKSRPQVVTIMDAPALVRPLGDKAFQVKVKYDCVGTDLMRLKMAFMERGDNGDGTEAYPPLNTLTKEKLVELIAGYQAGSYGSGNNKKIMQVQVQGMSSEDAAKLAEYVTKLKPRQKSNKELQDMNKQKKEQKIDITGISS